MFGREQRGVDDLPGERSGRGVRRQFSPFGCPQTQLLVSLADLHEHRQAGWHLFPRAVGVLAALTAFLFLDLQPVDPDLIAAAHLNVTEDVRVAADELADDRFLDIFVAEAVLLFPAHREEQNGRASCRQRACVLALRWSY